MTFEFFKGYPPDRETPIVELHVPRGRVVDIPAEIYREKGELRIAIFGRKEGAAWEFSLEEWINAIQRAIEVLGD